MTPTARARSRAASVMPITQAARLPINQRARQHLQSIESTKRAPGVSHEQTNPHVRVSFVVANTLGAVVQCRAENEWMQAHNALSRLAKQRAAADAEEGHWLLCALRSSAHVFLGFGTFNEYIERFFGYSARSTQEKLRVAEALEELPAMADALRSGKLNWSAVRELTRVAVPETEREWLAVAAGKTVHQLEALVNGKQPGDLPATPARPEVTRHVLRFDVTAETLALFREAMLRLRRDAGSALDHDAALMQMARHVLGGPRDDGRASYQIALSVCPECGAGAQRANGELVPVGPEVVTMADCDGQHLPLIHAASAANNDAPGAHTDTPTRATQTVPPATRRAVLQRDHHRCQVPGCRNCAFVDVHHVELRSEGGNHDPEKLVTLCGAHHRASHRGELVITGTVSQGLVFCHADGTKYGRAVVPRSVDLQTKAFGALRSLGFREGEVRLALDHVREATRSAQSVQEILRAALAVLTARSTRGDA